MDFAETRQRHLEGVIDWRGKLSRMEYANTFAISMGKASEDITLYRQKCSAQGAENLEYDPSTKTYSRKPTFKPIYNPVTQSELQEFRIEIPLETQKYFPNLKKEEVTKALSRAAHNQTAVEILYSGAEKTTKTRIIFPHTLIEIAQRIHTRAYCQESKTFKEFIVGRIEEIKEIPLSATEGASKENDREWNEIVPLTLKLQEWVKNPKSLQKEFGFKGETLTLHIRRSDLWALEGQLGLRDQKKIWERA